MTDPIPGSQTSAGTTFALTATLPATEDAAGYEAVGTVYTLVAGVESIPAFGGVAAVNSFQPLAGPVEKHKGPVNYGSLQIPMATNGADAGQALVATAAAVGNNALYACRVVYPNGEKRYFQARFFGVPETPGSATNVLMQTATVEICTKIVPVNPA